MELSSGMLMTVYIVTENGSLGSLLGGGVEDDDYSNGFVVDDEVEVKVDMTFDVTVEVDDEVAGMYALGYRVAVVWIARDRTEQSAEQGGAV